MTGPLILVMQSNGNLELKNGARIEWQTNTGGYPGAFVILRDDGKLVLYSYQGIELKSLQ